MKKHLVAVCLFIVLAALSCTPHPDQPGISAEKKDEAAIKAHIDKIFRAYIDKDSVTVRNTHAQNWRGFLSFSNHILRGIDAYMSEAVGANFDKNNAWHLKGYKMLDYDIIFHEQTGIVSYVAELNWQSEKDTGSYRLRSVDIYGKQNGNWTQIASNIGPLPPYNKW